jgi:hypothetical protein
MPRLYEIVETQDTLLFTRLKLGEGWVHIPARTAQSTILTGSEQQESSVVPAPSAGPAEPLAESTSEPEVAEPRAGKACNTASVSGRPSSEAVPQVILPATPQIFSGAVSATGSVVNTGALWSKPTYTGTSQTSAQAREVLPEIAMSTPVLPADLQAKADIKAQESCLLPTIDEGTQKQRENPGTTSFVAVPRPASLLHIEAMGSNLSPGRKRPNTTMCEPHSRRGRALKTKLRRMFKGPFRSQPLASVPPPPLAPAAPVGKTEGVHESKLRRAFRQGIKMVIQTRPQVPKLGRDVLSLRHVMKQAAKMR